MISLTPLSLEGGERGERGERETMRISLTPLSLGKTGGERGERGTMRISLGELSGGALIVSTQTGVRVFVAVFVSL